MRKFKTTKKGFTLMELIIVLALFSVIMVLVMSFIDPVARLMTQTSTREKTAAYVDNINEYVDKSLRYASFVKVYESDFCDKSKDVITEHDAVVDFVDDYFDGAINSSGAPIEGRVHVLKLLNSPSKDSATASNPAFAGVKDGVLIDSVYKFKAGDSKPEIDPNTGNLTLRDWDSAFKHADVPANPESSQLAVNPEHFQNYSYYFKLGYYEFIPVSTRTVTVGTPPTASKAYDASLLTKSDGTANLYVPDTLKNPSGTGAVVDIDGNTSVDFHYKELVPMLNNAGAPITVNQHSFAVTSVAYLNNAKGNHKIYCTKTYSDDSTKTESTAIFKSPCYVATSSMSLANVENKTKNTMCFMKQQEAGGADKAGAPLVYVKTYDNAYAKRKPKYDDPKDETDNIYFIYVVPSEIDLG